VGTGRWGAGILGRVDIKILWRGDGGNKIVWNAVNQTLFELPMLGSFYGMPEKGGSIIAAEAIPPQNRVLNAKNKGSPYEVEGRR